MGYQAGFRNTTGSFNSFAGFQAGYYNTTGGANNFTGYLAGYSNTTGSYNNFTGHYAGYYNTTGRDNNFLGTYAGLSNTTGSHNSFMGSRAGSSNTTGSYNIFLGNYAGSSNTTAYENSFMGAYAGYSNSIGSYNSFVGTEAGYANTSGGSNSFIGNEAGYSTTTGGFNSFVGTSAGFYNTTGKYNSFMGRSAGRSNTTGNGNVAVGYFANMSGGSLSNAAAIGFRAYVSRSNSLILGSVSGVNGATASTNIGIGTTAPAYRLHVNGSAAKPGSSTWTVASDKRLKQEVKQFTDGLEVLEQINPVRYRYNGKADMPTGQEFVGIVAQEVQQVAPYMIGKFTYQDTTGKQEEYLDYDATALTYILVNSVKELKQENEILKQELAQIKELLLKQMPATNNSEARLWQNTPNPYNQSTVIKYELPSSAGSASIKVYSTTGQEIQSFDITGKTAGEVVLSANTFAAGTYVYKLFVDGQSLDSKKLILVK